MHKPPTLRQIAPLDYLDSQLIIELVMFFEQWDQMLLDGVDGVVVVVVCEAG